MSSRQFAGSLFLCLMLAPLAIAASVSDFIDFSHPSVPGRLFMPPEASGPDQRPLILFLHGSGETGTNNLAQINANIDNLLDGAKDRGAFLYAPQATTFTWGDTTRTTNVMSMIDQAIANYNVDPNRIYVTGLSMGGGGVWNMVNRFEDRFAAAVPICGVSPAFDFSGANFVGTPVWAFHARDDSTVSSVSSRNVVSAILSAGSGSPVTYPPTTDRLVTFEYRNDVIGINHTEMPQGGHGIWGPVYDIPELYDWMFSQSLDNPLPGTPAGGGQVIMNNASPYFPIGDQSGRAIPVGSGFAAVGAFDLADDMIAATKAGTLSLLADSFTQFGASLPVGIRNVGGVVFGNIGEALLANDPLIGKNIYMVVGDGFDIESSDSLMVFKSNQQFTFETFSANLSIGNMLASGQLLLGTEGMVEATQPAGSFAGIIATAVNVPEPATTWLLAFGAVLAVSRRFTTHVR